MAQKFAGFNSSKKIRAALQAALFYARENRLEKLAIDPIAAAEAVILASSPFDWIDASDSAVKNLSGNDIISIDNKGSSSDALTRIANSYMQNVEGGATVISTVNNYQLGAAGSRNFMHDGTGFEWFFIFTPDSTASGNGFMWYTNISGSANPGAYARLDTDEDVHWVARGASSNLDVDMADATGGLDKAGAVPTNIKSIIHGYNENIAAPATEFFLGVNGAETYALNSYGFNYNSSNHADPLRLCVSMKGTFHGFVSFDYKMTDEQRAEMIAALRVYYGMDSYIDTYVCIGDSLMNGGALNTAGLDPLYDKVNPRSYIWGTRFGDTDTALTLRPVIPKNSQVEISANPTLWGFGPDLTLTYKLEQEYTNQYFAILKQAVAGDVTSTKWLPEGDANNSWDKLLVKKTNFDAYLISIGLTPRYKGIVVCLGTNDSDSSIRSGEFEEAAIDLITNLRSLFGSGIPIYWITPDVEDPASRNDGKFQYQDTVTGSLDTITAATDNFEQVVPSVVDVALSWREGTPNGIHFDMDACELIGIEIGNRIAS